MVLYDDDDDDSGFGNGNSLICFMATICFPHVFRTSCKNYFSLAEKKVLPERFNERKQCAALNREKTALKLVVKLDSVKRVRAFYSQVDSNPNKKSLAIP